MKAMKNETVTLSRGLAEAAANYMEGSASHTVITWCKEIRAALAEPVQPAGGGLTASMREDLQVLRDMKADADSLGETLDGESLAELAALEAADPVPPAGGDSSQTKIKPVFMLRAERLWGKDGEYAVTTEDHEWVNGCRKVGGDFPVYSGEAVTRLQAEVEQLKGLAKAYIVSDGDRSLREHALRQDNERLQSELTSANADKEAYAQNAIDLRKRVDALQSELTKALEDLSTANDKLRRQDIASQYKDGQIAKHDGALAMLQAELTKARELLDAIANWPDGGNRYGQENIKAFVIANRPEPALECTHD
jgi:valyl-tRNA synthetase